MSCLNVAVTLKRNAVAEVEGYMAKLVKDKIVVGNGFSNSRDLFREAPLPGGDRVTVMNEKPFDRAISRANRKADEIEEQRTETNLKKKRALTAA